MRGEAAEFVVGDRFCWAAPVVPTSSTRGDVGRVGDILVDAMTGELLMDKDTVPRVKDDADPLAKCSSP